jgi:hypothetical protein
MRVRRRRCREVYFFKIKIFLYCLDLSLSQVLDVFGLLMETYPRYVDLASREAVEEVGKELVRRDMTREKKQGVTERILGRIGNEVGRIVGRPK